MKKYICDVCCSGFKTNEGLENHEKLNPVIDSDYQDSILKNDKKYFIFKDINQISRKHDKLYEVYTLNKNYFFDNLSGKFLKKARVKFTSIRIEKELQELDNKEFLKVTEYLKYKGIIH
jgi:hypothetical protein